MNEKEMLEVTRRHQSELRQLVKVTQPNDHPEPESDQEHEVGWLSWRLRHAWQATLRPLRPQVGEPR